MDGAFLFGCAQDNNLVFSKCKPCASFFTLSRYFPVYIYNIEIYLVHHSRYQASV